MMSLSVSLPSHPTGALPVHVQRRLADAQERRQLRRLLRPCPDHSADSGSQLCGGSGAGLTPSIHFRILHIFFRIFPHTDMYPFAYSHILPCIFSHTSSAYFSIHPSKYLNNDFHGIKESYCILKLSFVAMIVSNL
jgi:hypothetical protein